MTPRVPVAPVSPRAVRTRRILAIRLRAALLLAALPLAALPLAACRGRGDARTVVTVYSPHGRVLLQHYERAFEAANPAVDVQWVEMGSQEVLHRIRAEKASPQADLWFGAPGDAFDRAAREGLLQPYRPTWAAHVTPDARDPQDRWYGMYLTPEVIGYNSQRVPAAQAPKDWDDVIAPQWKGRVVVRDPLASGSVRAIFGAMLARSIAETGSTEAGWQWLRQLDASTREYAHNPTLLHERLRRGDAVITLYNMPDIATMERRTGVPMAYVVPASGTPVLVDGIAVVRGAKQPAAAQRFYEFVTSAEALRFAADSLRRIPARTDLPLDSLPRWIRDAKTGIRAMPLDRQLMSDSLDVWMRHWDTHVRDRNRAS